MGAQAAQEPLQRHGEHGDVVSMVALPAWAPWQVIGAPSLQNKPSMESMFDVLDTSTST